MTSAALHRFIALTIVSATVLSTPPSEAGEDDPAIAPHPDRLSFPALDFVAPRATDHRHVLPSGVVVFVVEDHSLPLVDIDIQMRVGERLTPEALVGLADAVGDQLRAGGTESLPPADFDEEVDFLAAEIRTSLGDTTGEASLGCLAKDLEPGLALFLSMLRTPRFDAERLELWRRSVLQGLARRNDDTSSIESREWSRLLRGADHFSARQPTRASIEAIGRDELIAFHRRWIHPGNFVVAVSGDVETDDILARLERAMSDWPRRETAPEVQIPHHVRPVGLWVVDKSDVNQGRVRAGHLAPLRTHQDYHALLVMNHVLGGGGFTSRIMSRVRSDEGLAYSAGSRLDFGVHYDGSFAVAYQSKSESVAHALDIVLEEIERIRNDPISTAELDEAIANFVGIFPQRFATPSRIASTFAEDELEPRSEGFWDSFLDKVRAVTVEDVARVAKEHLHPDRLTILVVGAADDILAGDPDHPEYSLESIAKGLASDADAPPAPIRRIPLPDPESLIYPDATP